MLIAHPLLNAEAFCSPAVRGSCRGRGESLNMLEITDLHGVSALLGNICSMACQQPGVYIRR